MRILIVEDDALIALCIAEELTRAGHVIVGPASTTTEARSAIALADPDVALVDVDLEVKLAGVELARELTGRGIDCLFVTGQTGIARQHTDAAIGCVSKPYNPQDLCRFMDLVKDGSAADRSNVKLAAGFSFF